MTKILWRIAALFVISVPLNFFWEVTQMPLYVEHGNLLKFAVHCIIPSFGDGIIVLMIFAIGSVVMRRVDWFDNPKLHGYILMLASGLTIAVFIEWVSVYMIGRWSYTGNMPLLPVLNVGVSPVLQMLLLPPVIFNTAARWLHRKR
jgi:hypothetical protein